MNTPRKQIDFLPERYRQAKKRRHTSYWRLAVTLVFVVAFTGAAGGLYVAQRDVRRRSWEIDKLHAAAQVQNALLATKQAELNKLNVYASLVTHLRHPWPKSNIFRRLTATLPPEIVLAKVHVRSTPKEIMTGGGEAATATTGEPTTPTIEADLAEMQRQADEEVVVVALEGTTRDQTALHVYLQSLAGSPLFLTAELISVEAATGEQAAASGDRFTAAVHVRPGWSRPGGPQESDVEFDRRELLRGETAPPELTQVSAEGER
ncbi:MAG: PilN domain-containing protein [Planctomycetaceae bacterium]|nr:PilN domain-containing protein [Planctomycetaceae bacterium]